MEKLFFQDTLVVNYKYNFRQVSCTHEAKMCVRTVRHGRLRTDHYKKNFGGQLLCYKLKFEIS